MRDRFGCLPFTSQCGGKIGMSVSEVITQLKKGETVTVLEELSARKHKRGEPTKWAKIQLPPNTPVWAYAPYIETTNHTVNIKRLNLRAGPGENFSVIGRLDRGTEVKEIRTEGNWMEIEAPANAYAFVAADMLEKSGIAPAPATTGLAANANPGAAPGRPGASVRPRPAALFLDLYRRRADFRRRRWCLRLRRNPSSTAPVRARERGVELRRIELIDSI